MSIFTNCTCILPSSAQLKVEATIHLIGKVVSLHEQTLIVCSVDFDLCKPVSLNYLRRYSKAGDVNVLQHFLAMYVQHLSLCVFPYQFWTHPFQTTMCGVQHCNITVNSAFSVRRLVVKLASKMYRSCKLQAVMNKYKCGLGWPKK